MPTYTLFPHPDHPPPAGLAMTVEASRDDEALKLLYTLSGDPEGKLVAIGRPGKCDRTDGLWRTTCFELFLRFDDDERYVEFNFSPSTAWAAYAFDGYREGMTPLDLAFAPHIERLADGVRVACDLGGLPHGTLAMALTAVIEEEGGTKSYWSLAHPPGPPDFHHPACFAARLPAGGVA